MSTERDLARRYRRLLVWYPPEHRRDHGDEMLGVLLAAARPGQRYPALADAANLLWGALRIRLRASLRDHSDPLWRDALAVTSVAAPLALLGVQLLQIPRLLGKLGYSTAPQVLLSLGTNAAIPLLLTCLVLCRLRRTAIGVTLVLTVYIGAIGIMTYRFLATGFVAFYLLFGVLEMISLIASDGPRRGLEILTRQRRVLVVAGGIVTAAVGWSQISSSSSSSSSWVSLAALAAAAAALVVLTLLFPLTRRVLVLLAIPASPAAAVYAPSSYAPASLVLDGTATLSALSWLYLPSLLLIGVALAAARRSGRPPAGRGGHTSAGSGGEKPAGL